MDKERFKQKCDELIQQGYLLQKIAKDEKLRSAAMLLCDDARRNLMEEIREKFICWCERNKLNKVNTKEFLKELSA